MEALRSVVAVASNHMQACRLLTTVTWQTLNLIYKSCDLHLVLSIGQGGNVCCIIQTALFGQGVQKGW